MKAADTRKALKGANRKRRQAEIMEEIPRKSQTPTGGDQERSSPAKKLLKIC
jgi:hypothetical protein